MLLTLSAISLKSRLKSRRAAERLDLVDVPKFAREQLNLFGLNIHTELLAGADAERLNAVREAADKNACPCLVLIESDPQALGSLKDREGDGAMDRMHRVVQAASRLGCNSVALRLSGDDDDTAFDLAAERLKRILGPAEKSEINVLLTPHAGLTATPERLTELIKKVGGFRIGTFPDFEVASRSEDPLLHLRRVVPYASALSASTLAFKKNKDGEPEHEGFDLAAFAETVQAVGYSGTLGIEYRGKGDAEEGILQSRTILGRTLGLLGDEDS